MLIECDRSKFRAPAERNVYSASSNNSFFALWIALEKVLLERNTETPPGRQLLIPFLYIFSALTASIKSFQCGAGCPAYRVWCVGHRSSHNERFV